MIEKSPLLKLALSERFSFVPRSQLNRDLLIPLRNALGNAFKHGNAKNPAGTISIEIALTLIGALVTVSDEGPGFDVDRTFGRFQDQERYSADRGAGFRNLHQAKSTVSYENGGRTLLLCFRPPSPGDSVNQAHHEPRPTTQNLFTGTSREASLVKSVRQVLDPEWIRACLSEELADFRKGRARIESCRVYAIDRKSVV